MKWKVTSMLLALALFASMLPTGAFAQTIAEEPASAAPVVAEESENSETKAESPDSGVDAQTGTEGAGTSEQKSTDTQEKTPEEKEGEEPGTAPEGTTNSEVENQPEDAGDTVPAEPTPEGSPETAPLQSNAMLLDLEGENSTVQVDTLEKLQEAVENAGTAQTTIQLMADIDAGTLTPATDAATAVTVAIGQNITLDLNGYTLSASLNTSGSNYSKAHVILNNGTLTIEDSSAGHTGTIANTNTGSNACTRTIKNAETGVLNIYGGTIKGTVCILNMNTCLIDGENVVIESDAQFSSGGWDNSSAAIEHRAATENGSLTIHNATVKSASRAAIFCDGEVPFYADGGTFTGNTAYGAVNGSTADRQAHITGGTWSSDITAMVDQNAARVLDNEDGTYRVERLPEAVETPVSTNEALLEAMRAASLDKPLNIVVNGNVTLTESEELKPGSKITIAQGSQLTVAEGAVLTQTGVLTNNGTLTVNGFLTDPLDMVNNGTITGVDPTATDFTIRTPMDLQWVTWLVEYGKVRNITLANDVTMPAGVQFQMIGSGNNGFYGVSNADRNLFDGQGHTISNLTIRGVSSDTGLFTSLMYADVKNLTLDNTDIQTVSAYTAGVTGYAVAGVCFENITVTGKVEVTGASYGCAAIAAAVGNDETSQSESVEFINCRNEAAIGGADGYNIGSIFGTASGAANDVYVCNCSNAGAITAKGSVGYIYGYGALNKEGTLNIIAFIDTGTVNGTTGSQMGGVPGSGYTSNIDKADGSKFTAIQNPDGSWAGVSVDAVAVYKGTGYATLKEAVQAAETAGDMDITIQLLNDVTVDGAISSKQNLTVVGVPKADGSKPVVRSSAEKAGLFSHSTEGTTLTLQGLQLEVTADNQWYIYHSAGTLDVSDCAFVMGQGVTNTGNVVMGEGKSASDTSYKLIFTNNTVTANSRAALTGLGNDSKVTGNTIDLVDEHWKGEEGARTSILSLTAVQDGAGVEISGNTFLNANRGIAVDNSTLEADKVTMQGNVFDEVRFAFELSPTANKDCGTYDINENWYRFDGKVGQLKVQNADKEDNKFGFGEGSAEYLPAAGKSQTETTPYYIAMGSTASFDGDKTYTASTGDDVVTAVNAMKDGDTLKLDGNITLNSELTIDKDITVKNFSGLKVGSGKLVIKAGTYDADVTRYLPDGYKMEGDKVVKVESETTTPDDSTSDTTTDSPAPTATPAPTAAPTAQPAATTTAAIPQTSDTLPVGLLGGMAATAAAAFAALFVLRKRKSED